MIALLLEGRQPNLREVGRVEMECGEKPPQVLLVDGVAFVMNFFETPPFRRGHVCYNKADSLVVQLREA